MPVDGGDSVRVPARTFGRGAFESADGQYLYYQSDDGSIQRLNLKDGDEVKVLPSVQNDNYAIARGGIYFIPSGQHAAIQFLNFVGGKISTIAKLPQSPLYGFSLSPDEHWLLYTQYEGRGSNLMLVENFH
jgi:hypothetical protein